MLPVLLAGQTFRLETMIVRPDDGRRYPLMVLSHGSPRDASMQRQHHPEDMLPQARGLARLGWAVVVPMRRGYGESDGHAEQFSCDNPDYVGVGRTAAQDIRAVIAALADRRDLDSTMVIAVGRSAGGFASVALATDPPPGLRAVISFAGGRGSRAPDQVCRAERLVDAFAVFGRRSQVPMLWVYSENDHFFSPWLVQDAHAAFRAAGGDAQLIMMPPFGNDGHFLFSLDGRSQWLPLVHEFLDRQGLPWSRMAMPSPPAGLTARGREAFWLYLDAGSPKAFAMARDGSYGYRYGENSSREAQRRALDNCQRHAMGSCRLVMVDDDWVN